MATMARQGSLLILCLVYNELAEGTTIFPTTGVQPQSYRPQCSEESSTYDVSSPQGYRIHRLDSHYKLNFYNQVPHSTLQLEQTCFFNNELSQVCYEKNGTSAVN